MTEFTVSGACVTTEEPKYGLAERGFPSARGFQNRVVEWVNEGSEPVAALRAPTGAGKTATFHELIDRQLMTLLVYPTNALLRQQAARFRAEDVSVGVLDSKSLDGHGHERTENLLEFVNDLVADHEVVVTNPDILQAAIQDMYRGADAMRLFNLFESIVYDEFHFYDALAASGLLLQTKIIAERAANPKILLASATPNEDFIDFLREQVGLSVCGIEAEYVDDGDQFRYPVTVVRHEQHRLIDNREEIAETLRADISDAGEYDEPRVAIVFNSAKDSNDFHDFLYNNYPGVFEHAEKDNGFDTNDPQATVEESSCYILNTTSKGEVGLDYDIQTLYMENPGDDRSFLQRFGRAGRSAEATVHIYGLGQGPWGDDVSFQTFEQQIYQGLHEQEMETKWLADLVGFRAAYAIAEREIGSGWFNEELREDFESNIERYDRWRTFIRTVRSEIDQIKQGFEPGKYENNSPAADLLRFTNESFRAFRGLRGRSLQATVKYPRGDRFGLTTYGLTTTLRHYDIADVEDDGVLVLETRDDNSLSVVTAQLPEYESEPRQFNRPTREIESELKRKIHREIDRVEDDEQFEVSGKLLHRFFEIIRITDAVVPSQITTGEYKIEVDDETGGLPETTISRREI